MDDGAVTARPHRYGYCARCGAGLVGRSDARYCSDRCRVAGYRAREARKRAERKMLLAASRNARFHFQRLRCRPGEAITEMLRREKSQD